MKKWTPRTGPQLTGCLPAQALAALIGRLGEDDFGQALLDAVQPIVPAASFSLYQTGSACTPKLYLSGSLGVPDTTVDCWRAYLAGPQRRDRSLRLDGSLHRTVLCHMAARDAPREHRARVYEAHGVAERISVVDQRPDGGVFALNFYRHEHQRAFDEAQIAGFERVAPALLALARKQVALACGDTAPARWTARLLEAAPGLTTRELDVCLRLLRGMTQEGIAADLRLSVPTVKTYRNRAFARLGIHFRNELFAKVAGDSLH